MLIITYKAKKVKRLSGLLGAATPILLASDKEGLGR